MNRRDFLRTSGLTVLGVVAGGALVRGPLSREGKQSAVASAMSHFGVTEPDLKKVRAAGLERGGDYADLSF
ncbi:MAG: twin-arginine translocation signal domain-containing protein, partial [Bacteroides sp.]|nr:twin-arginine translocation signal domain-containing protein [Bacteroides sp.]